MTEVADTLALIRDRVDAHLIVDADTGYGNALNVVRTVREFERAGANAIQLEDQDFPKRCGHLDGKALIPAAEMCGKIRAAVDAAALARDADRRADRCGRGRRLRARHRARRDVSRGRRRHAVRRGAADARRSRPHGFGARPKLPLMANMVEGGKTPTLPAAELESIGFALVIFPGAIVRAFGYMASEFYTSLATHGSNEPYRNRMLDFTGINELIGTPEMIALGQQYETPEPPADKKTSVRR